MRAIGPVVEHVQLSAQEAIKWATFVVNEADVMFNIQLSSYLNYSKPIPFDEQDPEWYTKIWRGT